MFHSDVAVLTMGDDTKLQYIFTYFTSNLTDGTKGLGHAS